MQPLSRALGISVIELMNGEHIANKNASANMLRSKFYVCPICRNTIHSTGEAVVSCCGITLPALEAEEEDNAHLINIEKVEDEHFLSILHPMTKQHFFCGVSDHPPDSDGQVLSQGQRRDPAAAHRQRVSLLLLQPTRTVQKENVITKEEIARISSFCYHISTPLQWSISCWMI